MEPEEERKRVEYNTETNGNVEKANEPSVTSSRAPTNGTKRSNNKVDKASSNTPKIPVVDGYWVLARGTV